MAEYIEREKFLNDIEARYCVPCKMAGKDYSGAACLACCVDDMAGEIDDAPVADVAPVVHGRWDDSFDGITPYCSACGRSHRMMTRTPNYCPNCGAKMDGER